MEAHILETILTTDREQALTGITYKLKPPLAKAATYVTINDIILNQGTIFESRQPYEVFINSKDIDHHQWIQAITRATSAVFRQGMDCKFLLKEYCEIADLAGGGYMRKGKWIPSLVAEIGETIIMHIDTNSYKGKTAPLLPIVNISDTIPHEPVVEEVDQDDVAGGNFPPSATMCKECRCKAVIVTEGCEKCLSCGHSKCG